MIIYLTLIPVILILALVVLLFISSKKSKSAKSIKEEPRVSVVVAARNEANNIEKCISHLIRQDYQNFEVLIGNDASSDETLSLAKISSEEDERIQILDITTQLGRAKGKSNVLAQLIRLTKGDIILVTDADTAVPESWISTMVAAFEENTGIVTGVTLVKGKSLWARFQQIDWVYALLLVFKVSNIGFPVTSMGNNMAFRKVVYDAIGGYENLPFSITEDFQLFKSIIAKDWGFKNLFSNEVLAITSPAETWGALLYQRKRWMRGAMEVPWYFKFLLFTQAFYYPTIAIIIIVDPMIGLSFLVLKFFIQSIFIYRGFKLLKSTISLVGLLLFEVYSSVLTLMLLFFYILPIKIKWKERDYR